MDGLMFQAVSGGAILLLLSIIAYFLKLLIEDFRCLQQDFLEVKVRQEGLRAEIDRISGVLLFLKKQLLRKARTMNN